MMCRCRPSRSMHAGPPALTVPSRRVPTAISRPATLEHKFTEEAHAVIPRQHPRLLSSFASFCRAGLGLPPPYRHGVTARLLPILRSAFVAGPLNAATIKSTGASCADTRWQTYSARTWPVLNPLRSGRPTQKRSQDGSSSPPSRMAPTISPSAGCSCAGATSPIAGPESCCRMRPAGAVFTPLIACHA